MRRLRSVLIWNMAVGLGIIAIPLATALAQAPETRAPRPASIRAVGEATVTATPDQAEMNIAVVTQADSGDGAAAQNARKADAVIAAVRAAAGPGAEVKTVGYTIVPNYAQNRDGSEPRITGYTATNTIHVTTGDLNRVGTVIDAATKAGANSVQGLQFTLENDSAVQAEALRLASANARARAEAIARGLGVTVGRILQAEEGGATVRPYYADAMAVRTSAAKTPVEAGTVEVHASVAVTVSFE